MLEGLFCLGCPQPVGQKSKFKKKSNREGRFVVDTWRNAAVLPSTSSFPKAVLCVSGAATGEASQAVVSADSLVACVANSLSKESKIGVLVIQQ